MQSIAKHCKTLQSKPVRLFPTAHVPSNKIITLQTSKSFNSLPLEFIYRTFIGWRPSLVGRRPSLLGWRPFIDIHAPSVHHHRPRSAESEPMPQTHSMSKVRSCHAHAPGLFSLVKRNPLLRIREKNNSRALVKTVYRCQKGNEQYGINTWKYCGSML